MKISLEEAIELMSTGRICKSVDAAGNVRRFRINNDIMYYSFQNGWNTYHFNAKDFIKTKWYLSEDNDV